MDAPGWCLNCGAWSPQLRQKPVREWETRRIKGAFIAYQCIRCGRIVGNWLKRATVPQWQTLPAWDDLLDGQYRTEQNRLWRIRYEEYLKSPEWHSKRLEVLRRAGGVCERCHVRCATQVHHLSYANMGDEPLADLLAVCAPCHEHEHDRSLA